MYQASSGDGPADQIVPIDDLSLGTLIALVDRLRETETPNQFICREIEMDGAYLQADFELRHIVDTGMKLEIVEAAKVIRSIMMKAHDFVGESNVAAAVDELNRVIELKIGL